MTPAEATDAAIEWSEREVNRVWLNAVANTVEQFGRCTLDRPDAVRLREIAEQLSESPVKVQLAALSTEERA